MPTRHIPGLNTNYKRLKRLGIPYMGSKRRLAEEIVDVMLSRHPKAKYLYDLFGGGGAITLEAVQRPQLEKVIYNEKNTGVVELFKDILFNGITEKYYQWIDRETFYANKDKDNWLGGFCKVIWSFGSKQNTYLYGKPVETYKYLLHRIIVYEDEEALKELYHKYGLSVPMPRVDSSLDWREQITQRRLQLRRNITQFIKQYMPEPLRIFKSHEQRVAITNLMYVDRLRYITYLPKIYKNKIIIYNKSYDEVDINTPPGETIIYLDPPYKNKGQYQLNIDHDKLLDWIKYMSAKGYPIYVSSYEFDGLECVWEQEYRGSLSKKRNRVYERLFSNHNLL